MILAKTLYIKNSTLATMKNAVNISTLLIISFSGCGSSSSEDVTPSTINSTDNTKFTQPNISSIELINSLREKSGMIPLSQNNLLVKAAKNHANYLHYNNTSGHYESGGLDYFTGVSPTDRTQYVSYPNTIISENVSVGQSDENSSVVGLIGAIYHRYGFLSFSINEIGASFTDTSYVYDMGNYRLSDLCQGHSFESTGTYYTGVCLDNNFKISDKAYKNALNQTKSKNPPYVIYPYENQNDVTPYFYEESPDPLPNYDVSGIPISIEFNSHDFDMSNFTLKSFTLHDENNNSVNLISYSDGTKIMKKSNDINNEFTKYQFAIFPEKRLDYNKTYNAIFSYNYNAENRDIRWSFKTKALKNLLKYSGESLQIKLNKKYFIYIEPQTENDVIHTYNSSCTYKQGGNISIDSYLSDGNTIAFKVVGNLIDSCELDLDNGEVIHVSIQNN